MNQLSKDEVIKANIDLHTALASSYNSDEPHFRPENVSKVKNVLSALKESLGAETMLDIGCGTGFMIKIGKDLEFKKIVGLDITPAMLERVDLNGKTDIELKVADVTEPFPVAPGAFDIVTAYTFLSHLPTLDTTFSEACKALRPGGAFYSDLDPNFYFWQSMGAVDENQTHHAFLRREIDHTKNNDMQIFKKYGVSPEIYNTAEFQKSLTGGMKEESLRKLLLAAGFSRVEFKYKWFVGAAVLNNDASLPATKRQELMSEIESYLQAVLPLSKNLFKYISFTAYK